MNYRERRIQRDRDNLFAIKILLWVFAVFALPVFPFLFLVLLAWEFGKMVNRMNDRLDRKTGRHW